MRATYYEIEISPKNKLMLAKMTYKGENEKGPILGLDFVKEPFVKTQVNILDNGYEVIATFPKNAIKTGDGEIFFPRGGKQPAEGGAGRAPAVQKHHGGVTGMVFSVISAVDLDPAKGKAIHKKTPL
jgi:hypothetical protein